MHDLSRMLESLKALRLERSNSSPFGTHTEFLRWSDQVLPLLAFDEKLAAEFKHLVEAATAVESWRPERYVPNINNAVGCVTRAIALLEHAFAPIPAHNAPPPTPAPPSLSAPDKVTVKWLYEHVPLRLVSGGLGMLAAAFALGIAFSETQIFALTRSAIATPSSSSAKQPASTIESQPKNVSRTASSPK